MHSWLILIDNYKLFNCGINFVHCKICFKGTASTSLKWLMVLVTFLLVPSFAFPLSATKFHVICYWENQSTILTNIQLPLYFKSKRHGWISLHM